MSYSLGLDCSTQSCSGLIIDTKKLEIIASASINYGQQLPSYEAPNGFILGQHDGEVLADPMMWLDALEMLLAQLAQQADLGKVRAISGAAQQHASVYLNQLWFDRVANLNYSATLANQLRPTLSRQLSPIWMDHSTATECQEINLAIGGPIKVSQISGSVATERFTGPQIRRFAKLQPQAYQNTARIHLLSSFIASILCAKDAPIDSGDGAGMNLLNLTNFDWHPELLDATAPRLRQKLPPVVPDAQQIGSLCPYFQQRFGFAANVPVIAFTGDNPASLVGMGAGQPGQVVISLGTSDTLFAASPATQSPNTSPLTDPAGNGHVFGNPLGGTLTLQCFTNGSLAREAIRDQFNMDWESFSLALESTPPGNQGCLMLPTFTHETSPKLLRTTPLLSGDNNFLNASKPSSWIRACIEGQFLNMRLQTSWMNLQPATLKLTGGAAQNNAIAQVAADIFQCPTERIQITNSVALGSAIQAAHTSKLAPLQSLQISLCKTNPHQALSPSKLSPNPYTELTQKLDHLIQNKLNL